jgi:hypothetical protein
MEHVFFETSVHKNNIKELGFDLDLEENADVLSSLEVTIEGSIQGVDPGKIKEFMSDKKVEAVIFGLEHLNVKKGMLKRKEDFYRVLACLIGPDDYYEVKYFEPAGDEDAILEDSEDSEEG